WAAARKVHHRIVQKDEAPVGRPPVLGIAHTADARVALMPDCGARAPRAKVGTFFREVSMTRWIALLIAVAAVAGSSRAQAQELTPGPARLEVSIIPGGGLFFTKDKDTNEPAFGNYDLGGDTNVSSTTPHFLNYSGNLVVHATNHTSVVPYITGGVGGLSLFEKASLGIPDTETFFTANVGGGVKWYSGRWGLRADYRFVGVKGKDDAPQFFGRETRYGHRV